MIVIAVPIILFCVVLMTMYCLYQQYQRHSRPYAPPPDVDTSLLMPEEPQSLRELYDWSQSGSGSGLLCSQAFDVLGLVWFSFSLHQNTYFGSDCLWYGTGYPVLAKFNKTLYICCCCFVHDNKKYRALFPVDSSFFDLSYFNQKGVFGKITNLKMISCKFLYSQCWSFMQSAVIGMFHNERNKTVDRAVL